MPWLTSLKTVRCLSLPAKRKRTGLKPSAKGPGQNLTAARREIAQQYHSGDSAAWKSEP